MKKIIAFLSALAISVSVLSVGAAAFFEPMSVSDMKAELDSKYGSEDKNDAYGMVFGWDFDDVATETKELNKNVSEEIDNLVAGGKYLYAEESADNVAAMGIDKLTEFGTLTRISPEAEALIYRFADSTAASAFYKAKTESTLAAEDGEGDETAPLPYIRLCGEYVLEGEEALVRFVSVSEVYNSVKNGDYSSADFNIQSGAYSSVSDKSLAGMQFKNYDGAIRLEDGELVFGKAYKDYDAEKYGSTDAYMDVYFTDVDYNKAHDASEGKSFVISASIRAPYLSEHKGAKIELFRTRSSFTGVDGKTTIDRTLAGYDVAKRQVLIYSGSDTIETGIYLSDYDYTTVAVHVHPTENKFDFYADGILVVSGADFLTDAQLEKVAPSTNEKPSGAGKDYTLNRLRLFYSGISALTDDMLCINDFAWYYSEEYLEREEKQGTVIGISTEIKEKIYLNFYMNFTLATVNDYTAMVEISAGSTSATTPVMSGELVESGEYAGLLKYSIGIAFADFSKEIKLSLTAGNGRSLHIYNGDSADYCFLGARTYKTTLQSYFSYLMDEANGYDEKTVGLARAVLNLVTNTMLYLKPNTTSGTLPNAGCEYTENELGAVTADIIREAAESENYKNYGRFGNVQGLKVISNSLLSDSDGIYVSVKYSYIGMRKLTVNDQSVSLDEDCEGEYRIYISSPLQIDNVFTVTFTDGEDFSVIKNSACFMAANMMSAPTAKPGAVNYVKALYLYLVAAENYSM